MGKAGTETINLLAQQLPCNTNYCNVEVITDTAFQLMLKTKIQTRIKITKISSEKILT